MQGTHGLNCASKCNCEEMYTLDTTCDPVTGQCRCRPGWTGLKCDQNVNECETLDRPCPALEKCFNTPGSYRCDCIENFVRVNGKCEGKISF